MTIASTLEESPHSNASIFGNYLIEQFCQDELFLADLQCHPAFSDHDKFQLRLITGKLIVIKFIVGLGILATIPIAFITILHFAIWQA